MTAAPPSFLYPRWEAPPRVRAAFSLRSGGVSAAPYGEFNLGAHVGDDPAAVAENRHRLRMALSLASEPLWPSQQHGIEVLDADRPRTARPAPPPADAAVTRAPGTVLSVLVADCLAVVLADEAARAVGIAHAGWRGLAGGVIEAVVQALGSDPGRLQAWIAPGIGPAHFEVGEEVRVAFVSADAQAGVAFERNERGRWQCDLYRLAEQRLRRSGVSRISGERRCTYAEPEAFYSFRRDSVTGRMAALVWIED